MCIRFHGLYITSFHPPFSPITRDGATKLRKREEFTSAHLFSAWRSEDAGTRAHETSAFIGVKIKMAAVTTLCKMCRTYISTNIAMHSQTAKAAAKVGACFTSCLLCIG